MTIIIAKTRALFAVLRGKRWLNRTAAAISVLLLPFLCQSMIEWVRIESFSFWLEYVRARLPAMLPAYVMLVLAALALVLLSRRPWVSNLVIGGACFIMAVVNRFKLQFRGDPLLPKDIFQAREGAMIAGEITLRASKEMVLFGLLVLLSVLLFLPFRLRPFTPSRVRNGVIRVGSGVLCFLLGYLFLFEYIGNKALMDQNHGVQMRPLSLANSFYSSSFLTGFLYLSANLRQLPPEGYSAEAVQAIAQQAPKAGQKSPDVILVLMESFYDLATIEGTSYSEELLPNYARLREEGISGQLLVDKHSGGTSDYEFQAMTGFATALMPVGSVPMLEYVRPGMPSLPNYLAGKGYQTLAIHPYIRSFYGRPEAYENMGIQRFLAVEDFPEGLEMGTYVSDDALAGRVIAEYETASAEGPVFMNVVSMQNHMPYTPGAYPEDYRVHAQSGAGEVYDAVLSTYATGVRDADAMMGRLCDYFREVERDVVLIFYGDHQTAITDDLLPDLVTQTQQYAQANEAARWQMTHTTPYLIWGNYSLQPANGGTVAPYMLGALAGRYLDVDVPSWMRWLGETLPASGGASGGYYLQADGSLAEAPAPQQQALFEGQAMMQYDLMFGRQYWLDAAG